MYEQLTKAAQDLLKEHFDVSDASITWEKPQDAAHGDIATPVALQLAKQVGKAPRDIAQILADHLTDHPEVDRLEVAGPGYVNIWLAPAAFCSLLKEIRLACNPQEERKDEVPIVVEYSSPNIAKPLGVHHLLSTIIGQVTTNLHRHFGEPVLTVNHLGDWGTQFGKLYVAWQKWGEGDVTTKSLDELLELYVRFHNEAEKDEALDDEARDIFRQLEEGNEEIRAFWQTVVDISMKDIHALYDRLHVEIEYDHGESMYEDKMQPIIEEGKEKGVFKEGKGGALIAEFPEDTHMPPAIVLKADGSTIYHTRDLATIHYRMDRWHPRASYYVVGAEQQLYFQQLFHIVGQLEWDLPHLEHIHFGRMSFTDRKMSTRKGTMLKLREVLDEAVERATETIKEHGDAIQSDDPDGLAEMMGIGAVVYGIISQNRKMDIVFDWKKVLAFDGNSAPYLQYTHARACSIVRKAESDQDPEVPVCNELTEKDRGLINTLLQFPRALNEALEGNMPHVLCQYLFSLCQAFNAFYAAEPILKAENEQKDFRVALTALTARVLKTSAELLTLRVPDRM